MRRYVHGGDDDYYDDYWDYYDDYYYTVYGGDDDDYICDPHSFHDLVTDNFDGVCGPCLVLANYMDTYYGTCRAYCADQGLDCVMAWEEIDNDCGVDHVEDCDYSFDHTSDALCECGSEPQGFYSYA